MMLTKLQVTGLKSNDFDLTLGPVVWLHGENGVGKSSILAGIHLLALGSAPGVPANSAGVMRLARDGKFLAVHGQFSDGTWVDRSWKEAKDGSIKAVVKTNLEGSSGRASDNAGLVRAVLGGFADAWDLGGLFRLKPTAFRQHLIALLPSSEYSLDALVPSDCPEWALPDRLGRRDPEEWIAAAKAEVADRIRAEKADAKSAAAVAADVGDAWAGAPDPAPIAAELRQLRDKLVSIKERELLLGRITTAEKDLEARRARLGVPPTPYVATPPGVDLVALGKEVHGWASTTAGTKAELELARKQRADLERGDGVVDVCPNCGHDLGAAIAEDIKALSTHITAIEERVRVEDLALARAEKARNEAERTVRAVEAAARAEANAINRYADEKRRIGELDVDLEVMKAERDELRPVTESADLLEQQIAAAQKRLTECGVAKERVAQLARAKADAANVERRIKDLEGIAEMFAGVEASMMRRGKQWLEARFSAAYGGNFVVEMRRDQDPRIEVDGVDISAKSDGEQIRLGSALAKVTGDASAARWRPLLVDRGESVSAGYRQAWLESLVQAQRDGSISQAVICSCAEVAPVIDGVTVIELGAEEERPPVGRVTFVSDGPIPADEIREIGRAAIKAALADPTILPEPGRPRAKHRTVRVSRTQPALPIISPEVGDEYSPDPDPLNGADSDLGNPADFGGE